MLNIAIVEDNKIQAELISSYLTEWSNKNKDVIKISVFNSAENFLFECNNVSIIDAIILDIELKKINGMELAKKLRKQNYNRAIIFITAIPDYMQDGYDVEALHYILKPINKEKLFNCLTKISVYQKIEKPIFIFEYEKNKIKIFQEEIIFIESISHKLKIKTTKKEYMPRMLFSYAVENLDQNLFVKTHRAFLVNIKKIKQVQKETVIMTDKSKIPISRREYKTVNKKFIDFFRNRI